MKEIIIKIPDDFTEDQTLFIKKSAVNQIEAEMKKVLVIPKEEIDAVQLEADTLRTAMGLPTEAEIEAEKEAELLAQEEEDAKL